MKIKFSGPVVAFDAVSKEDISDLEKLKAITATETDECFSAHFQSFELRNTGVTDGFLRFELDGNNLRVVTEYESSHVLTEVEVSALLEYTLHQWKSGIGDDFSQVYSRKHHIQIAYHLAADVVMVEQEFEQFNHY